MNKENWRRNLFHLPYLLNSPRYVAALRSVLLSTNILFSRSLYLRCRNCYSNILGKCSLSSRVMIWIYVYISVHRGNLFIWSYLLSHLEFLTYYSWGLKLNLEYGSLLFWTRLRKVWEQKYIVTNSFLIQMCYLALQKVLNLSVCFPSVKLNVTCHFFLYP